MAKNETKSQKYSTGPRSVIPNGKEIKRLRNEKGITQKDLGSKTLGVSDKTLYRAEQSHPISMASLKGISSLLGVSVDAILENRTENYSHREIILTRKDPPSGSDLLKHLTPIDFETLEMDIRFAADPDQKQAKKISELIQIFESIVDGYGFADPYPDLHHEEKPHHSVPAATILVIGRLNQLLKELAENQIYLFYRMRETYFKIDFQEAKCGTLGVGLKTESVIELLFSTQQKLLVTEEMDSVYRRKPEAREFFIDWNLERMIIPDDLPESWHRRYGGFKEKYEIEFKKQYSHLTLEEFETQKMKRMP